MILLWLRLSFRNWNSPRNEGTKEISLWLKFSTWRDSICVICSGMLEMKFLERMSSRSLLHSQSSDGNEVRRFEERLRRERFFNEEISFGMCCIWFVERSNSVRDVRVRMDDESSDIRFQLSCNEHNFVKTQSDSREEISFRLALRVSRWMSLESSEVVGKHVTWFVEMSRKESFVRLWSPIKLESWLKLIVRRVNWVKKVIDNGNLNRRGREREIRTNSINPMIRRWFW